jgi:hypothetical protein
MNALLSELAVIDGAWPRLVWLVGALRLVASLNWDRILFFLASPFAVGGCIMAFGAAAAVALFLSGGEGVLAEDDAFLFLALLSGITSAVFILLRVLGGHGRASGSVSAHHKKGGMPHMTPRFVLTALAGLALTAGAVIGLSNAVSAGRGGVLDDGEEHLARAGITLDEAIASAQSAASGPVDEVDLEYWQGKLVFNVDVGDKDVKVDALTGIVLSASLRD